MSLTRRDYVMLAETLKWVGQELDYEKIDRDTDTDFEFIVKEIASRLAADNKAFDCDRFLKDCGVV